MRTAISRLKLWIRGIVFHIIKPPSVRSYSQAGEDAIISFLFEGKGIKFPSYLELGTYHPINNSNTYLFYARGSKGVCVEADETLIETIRKVRPRDIVLNVGATSERISSVLEFYIFNDPSLNTFDKAEADFREKQGSFKVAKVVKVPLKPINLLIEENFQKCPDFLSIDIEGLDLAVLKNLDFKRFPIPVLCVETCTYSENHVKPKNPEIEEFMHSIGYFTYADTYVNTIFVNTKWFDIVE